MRTIKFRAWDKNKKKWLSKQFTEVNGLGQIYFNDYPTDKTFSKDEDIDPIVMQYTGLKDKNGKEIYEGDIVENKPAKGEVVYNEGAYNVDVWYLHRFCAVDGGCEVIGNIYENKDLL